MLFDKISDRDIIKSMVAETAKAVAELKCLRRDAEQIDARLRFLLAALHHLKDKIGDRDGA